MASYCEYVTLPDADPLHKKYHDEEYGFPLEDDNSLFGRLILEINQAGLSWLTILKKKDNFFKAFQGWNLDKVSKYRARDTKRLLNDAGIIRNRLKIEAAIDNARRIKTLQNEYGSFKKWIDLHHPKRKDEWVKLFKQTFRFTGGEIVNEFLVSTGYLPGAHIESCPMHKKVLKKNPPWSTKRE